MVASAGLAWAQVTAFSYQGQLTDGAAAANGTYDLTFSLWNAATDGAQQGATLIQSALGVTNGLFTATLDFGAQFPGAGRWLEIAVRTNGAAAFTTLVERQPVLPTPYAIHAATAGSATTATTVTGPVPAAQVTGSLTAAQIPNLDASKITSGTLATAQIPNLDAAKITSGVLTPDRIPTLDASKISGGTFTGNGAGLSGIPLSALVQSDYSVAAWGNNTFGQTNVPDGLRDVVAIAAGNFHSLALKADGTVVAWGSNTSVPAGLSGVVAIAAGGEHRLALKADGTVVAWGFGIYGETNVPAGLSGVVAIAAGYAHSLALKADGTVVGWGLSSSVPAGLSGVVAIAAGGSQRLALKADGTVVAWGSNTSVPAGLSGVVAIAAGGSHSLALKADGTVVAWGITGSVPAGLSGVVAIAAGGSHSLALKADGTVVAWGASGSVPTGLSGVVAIAAGGSHSLALKANGVRQASLARLDLDNDFSGTVSALGFYGNGAGLASLNASALSSGTVPAARIPSLDAGKVTTGTFAAAQIPNLDAGKIATGTLAAAQIPSLDAGKVTTGTFAPAQIPDLDAGKITSGTFTGNGSGLTDLNATALASGTVPVARIPNLDASKITTGTFTGNGSGLTSLNASALSAGTIADLRLSANIPRLDGSPTMASPLRLNGQKLVLASGDDEFLRHRSSAAYGVPGPVLSGTFGGVLATGDGISGQERAVLLWRENGTVNVPGDLTAGTVSGSGSGLTSLNASALTTGNVADARLSANVALLNGSPEFTSNVRLDDHDLYLRGGTDSNHGLGWFGGSGRTFAGATVDGPVVYGFLGGALGSTSSSQKLALRWNSSQQVAIGGGTPDSALTVSATGAGISAETVARFRNTTAGQHTAIAVDAAAGQDAVIYLGNNGTRAWDIRHDQGSGELQFRTQTDNSTRMRLTRTGNLTIVGSLSQASDRNVKAGFAPVDVEAVLAKVAALPLTTWHYTNDVAATPHLGPMAQDFHAAFGLGGNDKTIATVDADGVALAAIQGLHRKTEVLAAENADLRGELTDLRTLVLQLQHQLNANRP